MKVNQRGFGGVEILIVIIVLGLVGAASFFVYDRQKSKANTGGSAAQISQQTQKQESPNKPMPQENTVKYKTYENSSVRFEYPEDWKIDNTTSFTSIQSPDFSKEGTQVMKINNGAFIEVSTTEIPQKDRTADNFQSWGDQYFGDTRNAKSVIVSGKKVIQFDAQYRNGDYTWDAATTIFFRGDGIRAEVRYGYKEGNKLAHNATYQHVLETMKIE